MMNDALKFVVLLTVSNTFMTIAWYGHLKHKGWSLVTAIVVSWLIAFAEYVFQVPANRYGSRVFSLMQLKIAQECITLVVFVIYAWIAYRQPLRWNNIVAMALIVGAVFFTFFETASTP
jgi:uncharacterized protein (DUF486 family)